MQVINVGNSSVYYSAVLKSIKCVQYYTYVQQMSFVSTIHCMCAVAVIHA